MYTKDAVLRLVRKVGLEETLRILEKLSDENKKQLAEEIFVSYNLSTNEV